MKTSAFSILIILFFLLTGSVLFAANPDLKQITTHESHDYHVKWSPDGMTLAFTSQRDGEPKIWLNPAGGEKGIILESCIHMREAKNDRIAHG